MRLICTIETANPDDNPYGFSYYLASQGIENQCEEAIVEGKKVYNIWIFDEDLVDKGLEHYKTYLEHPQDPLYHVHSESMRDPTADPMIDEDPDEVKAPPKRRRSLLSSSPYGPVSIVIIFSVITLFIWSHFQRSQVVPSKIPGVIQAPLLSPIEQSLIFDYPAYFILRDKLLTLYTATDIEEKKPPSPEAVAVLKKLYATPVWMGIYDRLVDHLRQKEQPVIYSGPAAEDLSNGELWRLFTPAFLHFDFLHIFFNLLWFILLGNQIEHRIGSIRYLLMIAVIALVSNVSQYLMSGPFFMGLSGIICGMAAFIWARQQIAPWEGYLLNRLTLVFLAIFVVGMFALQILFFFLQVFGNFNLTIGIANTAHIMGGVVGYGLGRIRRLFAIQKKMESP